MAHALPQRILVAPSGFKESLDAAAVAAAIGAGVRRALPGATVKGVPIADGGEGTAETLACATGGHLVPMAVTGPVGQQVESHYAMLGGEAAGTAVVEMAAAAGLRLVPRDQRDPGTTTSYGVGELIAAAIDAGASKILVGCGDSGTSDGGMGALQALGARILDANGHEVKAGGNYLGSVDRLDLSGLHPALAAGNVRITMALNLHNVLTGPRGVARVFGPQKGATRNRSKSCQQVSNAGPRPCGAMRWSPRAPRISLWPRGRVLRAGWALAWRRWGGALASLRGDPGLGLGRHRSGLDAARSGSGHHRRRRHRLPDAQGQGAGGGSAARGAAWGAGSGPGRNSGPRLPRRARYRN